MHGEESELANQVHDPGMVASRDGMRARDPWEMDRPARRRDVADMDSRCKHTAAMTYFNSLILDLKLQLLNKPHDPITLERLDESGQHFRDLELCTERIRFYR